MDITNYLLVCLMEESAEIAHAAAKSIRFGLDDSHPERVGETNEDDLLEELYQCIAVVEMLQENKNLKTLTNEEIQCIKNKKKEKMIKYMSYSKEKGQLN
ncbi:hypothetical protein [Vagococcus fluvialis]|uniref:hypothetical protein n=1 Tax=Vagococcus fluvialis TaxID=2738 RepID=UPI002033A5AE|nr:hypothetical protein [Vagococcus fluvialis]MCM2140047.1 hypothetical protein [Vagococcus fluvialis]MDT2745790.1 hypothetical protein [Vagococcus fluvialis]